MTLLYDTSTLTVLSSAAIFLVITLLLVVLLLVARHYLVPQGKVKISVNGGAQVFDADTGGTLLETLHHHGVMLSSACGGKGSCGQ